MLFCFGFWVSSPLPLEGCISTKSPTRNLSKVHRHTADTWAHLFLYSWHHLHPDFFFLPQERLARAVPTVYEKKQNKVNNGAIHRRRCDFPPCFFCSAASKRPSMTSSLATVKTFEGPDGSGPDYWVFLSPASKGKFSCSLSPYLYKLLSTLCLPLLHQWQCVCTSVTDSSRFCDWLKGLEAIKKPAWRKWMQWSIRWMNLKVEEKYYWVLVSCQSTKFVGRKHQVYSIQVTRNCRRERFMHSCVAKNPVKKHIFFYL